MANATHSLPNLLLIGDSIRVLYQPAVTRLLEGRATVHGVPENARFALYTLQRLDTWLAGVPTPKVIHWNNGLWDCGHSRDRVPAQLPLEMYVGNLALILARLRRTGASIVWASITPIHPTGVVKPDGWHWRLAELEAYNAAATELMQREGVPINDLHGVLRPRLAEYLAENDHHINAAGAEACARAVAAACEVHL